MAVTTPQMVRNCHVKSTLSVKCTSISPTYAKGTPGRTGRMQPKMPTKRHTAPNIINNVSTYNIARISISTNPPLGNAATATAERAGKGAANRVEYTSLRTAKLAISVKKTVVFTT